MPQFICPYCEQVLEVPPEYVGRRGRCNKCSGHIALVGESRQGAPIHASRVEEAQPAKPSAKKAAVSGRVSTVPTEKQIHVLTALGVAPDLWRHLDRKGVSELIEQRIDAQKRVDPPTEKQVAYMRRLGVPEEVIQRTMSKSEVTEIIEDCHLQPSPEQKARLLQQGVGGAKIAALKNRLEARLLLESME